MKCIGNNFPFIDQKILRSNKYQALKHKFFSEMPKFFLKKKNQNKYNIGIKKKKNNIKILE